MKLKPAVAYCRIVHGRSPSSAEDGSIEAETGSIPYRNSAAGLRPLLRTAPLKHGTMQVGPWEYARLRPLLRTAPLKLGSIHFITHSRKLSPSSAEDGSIEAIFVKSEVPSPA